jgi:NAD(P)-dependent dehydrogenase (short-subunit alcohol dehydrogenase family)
MTSTLITGANKGLGYETARRLIAAGHTVYIGSRNAERGRQAAGRLGAIWSTTSPLTRCRSVHALIVRRVSTRSCR